jgi:hypothetical protein
MNHPERIDDNYRPWRYAVDEKFDIDGPLFPNDRSKVRYSRNRSREEADPASYHDQRSSPPRHAYVEDIAEDTPYRPHLNRSPPVYLYQCPDSPNYVNVPSSPVLPPRPESPSFSPTPEEDRADQLLRMMPPRRNIPSTGFRSPSTLGQISSRPPFGIGSSYSEGVPKIQPNLWMQ